jgi:hypothetical protein
MLLTLFYFSVKKIYVINQFLYFLFFVKYCFTRLDIKQKYVKVM